MRVVQSPHCGSPAESGHIRRSAPEQPLSKRSGQLSESSLVTSRNRQQMNGCDACRRMQFFGIAFKRTLGEHDMRIRTAKSKGIDSRDCGAVAVRPRFGLDGNSQLQGIEGDVWVRLMKMEIAIDDSMFDRQHRFEHTRNS